jgi:hypothetical protein
MDHRSDRRIETGAIAAAGEKTDARAFFHVPLAMVRCKLYPSKRGNATPLGRRFAL